MADCKHCGYNWIARTKSPKSCPRCKQRLDYKHKKTNLFHKIGDILEEEFEVE